MPIIVDGPPGSVQFPGPFAGAGYGPVGSRKWCFLVKATLNDLTLTNPAGSVALPPPGGGVLYVDSFFDVFTDIDLHDPPDHYAGTQSALVTFKVNPPPAAGNTVVYQTELLSMNLGIPVSGGQIIIRESPVLISAGQIMLEDLSASGGVGPGPYRIDSFFDVFTELSLDGGQSWIPGDGPVRLELMPEPTVPALLALGGLILGARRQGRH